MAAIQNEITINAAIEKVWSVLAKPALLAQYDPTVKSAILISDATTGIGAKRKVTMLDGKNWFDEEITIFHPNQSLTWQLTACSFPIHSLQHDYSFEVTGNQTTVRQIMTYTVKFGILGQLLDYIMIRKQFNTGIQKFLTGLKTYTESNEVSM